MTDTPWKSPYSPDPKDGNPDAGSEPSDAAQGSSSSDEKESAWGASAFDSSQSDSWGGQWGSGWGSSAFDSPTEESAAESPIEAAETEQSTPDAFGQASEEAAQAEPSEPDAFGQASEEAAQAEPSEPETFGQASEEAAQAESSAPETFGQVPEEATQDDQSAPDAFGQAPEEASQAEPSAPEAFGQAPEEAAQDEQSAPDAFGQASEEAAQAEPSAPDAFGQVSEEAAQAEPSAPEAPESSHTPPRNPYDSSANSGYYHYSRGNMPYTPYPSGNDSSRQSGNPHQQRGWNQPPAGNPYTPPAGGDVPPQQPASYSPMGGPWETPVPEKRRMGTAQKWFLGIIIVLAAGMAVGFFGNAIASAFFGNTDGSSPLIPENPSSSSQSASSSQAEATPSPSPEASPGTGTGAAIEIVDLPEGEPLEAKEVYQKVAPSVVGIVATVPSDSSDGGSEEEATDQGSGIIATSDGYIITNSHVVNDSRSTKVTVVTRDDVEYDGVVVGYDRTTDLAVIKIDAEGLTPAEFGDVGQMSIGDTVLAIGNPGGLDFASSMTRGIISALDRRLESSSENGMTYIQTDAAINPGNSGGALVNTYGQVIGINSSKLVAEDYEGMGFAIPVSRAEQILNSLMNVGYVEGRTRLGITGRDLSEQEAQFYDVPMGFLILEIDEDSDITAAGGAVGDIICGVDGQEVSNLSEISAVLLNYSPGDQITLTLYRMSDSGQQSGSEFDITITLLEDKGETQSTG